MERINFTAPTGTKDALDELRKIAFRSRAAQIVSMLEPQLAEIRRKLKKRPKLQT